MNITNMTRLVQRLEHVKDAEFDMGRLNWCALGHARALFNAYTERDVCEKLGLDPHHPTTLRLFWDEIACKRTRLQQIAFMNQAIAAHNAAAEGSGL